MPFTVTGSAETSDSEFEAYARVLRWQGKELGNLLRAPDPLNPERRWVHIWNTREEAQQFANELLDNSLTDGWHVEQVDAVPSNGPFGPLLMHLTRQSDGLRLGVRGLSLMMIRDAFPEAMPRISNATINTETWKDFAKTHGNLSDWVDEIAPLLTGLNLEQLTELGYAVIDVDTDQTAVFVPPAGLVEVHA